MHYYGHPVLRAHCKPIPEVTDEVKQLVEDLIDTVKVFHGAGLAAPQIGVALRVFVLFDYLIEGKEDKWTLSDEPRVYINPKITILSGELEECAEGCLSLPGMRVKVLRPVKIKVEAIDRNGSSFEEIVEGYNARVRLHENDHLNGVLMIDRTDAKTRRHLEPVLRSIKKKYTT